MPARQPADHDPLDAILRPPFDETPEEKASRVAQEEEARRVSLAIDDSIRQDRIQRKKAKVVRLLLLGQSESAPRRLAPSLHSTGHRSYGDSASASDTDSADTPPVPALPGRLSEFRARLAPLRHVESLLVSRLVPPSEDAPFLPTRPRADTTGEVFVRPGSWKRGWRIGPFGSGGHGPVGQAEKELAEQVQGILWRCSSDLMSLWYDQTVRAILRKRKVRLEESPGFFLNDLPRVTSLNYSPSDARLKTVGVSEYRFEMEAGSESGTQWRIIDVGGSRSQVQSWVPFFDDIDAIIFLAPISGFDQTLAEDRSVNRLEDSVLLWKAVCGNKLLARVDLVLFLNKCDILASKLSSGVRLAKYVKSFGERSNDADTAEKCKGII
ncbi:G-protein alpha subunit-domain-containing protein [Fomitopsis serialis]|uniref:G-protein alpha subunit-domain-containing protein n=1 Tax=Fomitopsis serialis TaxID=139415 RepID=UPI00200795FC|nr:G-protein alpha subunit-domain-containing protein [Neoantrodia serialis]KAH9932204.1 G-protein alpha subunit-domain-containing protein [Neoantrodia serialis]